MRECARNCTQKENEHMVSSALNTLRGMAQKQADNYNTYLPASTKIRQDTYLDGDARAAQISKLATSARAANQALLDSANANDAKLQALVAPSTADVSEASLAKVRYAYNSLGLSLQAICQQLVSDGDRDGFKALRQVLPWQIRASKTDQTQYQQKGTGTIDGDVSDGLSVIATYERALLTPAEQAARLEAMESATNMGRVKDNWQALDDFYAKQLLPGAVAGMFTRLHSIFSWQEVSGLGRDGSLIYTDQRSGSSRINLVADVVPTVTWGVR